MKDKMALKYITYLSAFGVLFSGYLSAKEFGLFGGTCTSCTSGILGLPACIYGLVMYLAIFYLSFAAQKK